MKYHLLLSLVTAAFMTACSSSSTPGPSSSSRPDSTETRIHSQTIYARGVEAGQRAMACEPDSRERETELLRAHAIVSALEDSGFTNSAADFKAGVRSVIGE